MLSIQANPNARKALGTACYTHSSHYLRLETSQSTVGAASHGNLLFAPKVSSPHAPFNEIF